jgi:hypothetical protein
VILFLLINTSGLFSQKSPQLIHSLNPDSSGQNSSHDSLNTRFRSIEEYIEENQGLPVEKIFLHTDRLNYIQGDTLWFKGYLWYGYDQIPDTVSGVMHVDLINSEGKILRKRKLLVQNGTSNGEFCLDTTIMPGRYALRASTKLMHNLSSGEPFYRPFTISPSNHNFRFECTPVIIKEIRNDSLKIGFRFFETDQNGNFNNSYRHEVRYSLKIGDQVTTDSILLENTKEHILKYRLAGISSHDSVAEFGISVRENRLTSEKRISIPLQENVDLQFFPEGGNLVNGLLSKVAFKAIGTDGLGKEVSGEIRTTDDKVVATFKSTFKGMGTFLLKPLANQKYSANFWYKNQKYIVPLPQSALSGIVMSARPGSNDIDRLLSIRQAPSGEISPKYVIGSAYGKIWFSALLKSFTDSCSLKIPVELLTEGVCRLTVLNSFFEPECERLIYINKNQRFKVEVIPDSSSYSTRSKVTILIKANDPDGNPVLTNLSLAVSDMQKLPKEAGAHGISAYRLLESELKGYIEDAESYFKDDSRINENYLDLLLLTQGYRKFVSDNSKRPAIYFIAENSFNINGKITFGGSKTQERKVNYRDINLSLMSVSDKPFVGLAKPDSMGNFSFQVPLMTGKPHLMLQATTSKNKPFNGDITMDKPADLPKFSSLPASVFNTAASEAEYLRPAKPVTKKEIATIPDYGLMSKTLGEVTVTAKATAKNWWRNYDKDAVKIADLDSLDPGGDRYRDLNNLLVQEFGARAYNNDNEGLNTVLLPCVQFALKGMRFWFPIYLIDGKKYWNGEGFDFTLLNTLSAFPVNEIKRILIIPPGKSIVMNYAYKPIIGFPQFILQSMVVIETYSKSTYRGDIQGVKKFILDGLDVSRVFYSPRYDGPARNNPEFDGRATLLWVPSIYTDSSGQARIDFYTGDRMTNLEVIVNGIETKSGFPGNGNVQIRMKSTR